MSTNPSPLAGVTIRRASPADLPALRDMHARSLRGLSRGHYGDEAIEAFLTRVGTIDDTLIAEGTYWVADLDGMPVASGGFRRPGRPIGPGGPIATQPMVRALYVDPLFAGLGLGRRMLDHVEAAIAAERYPRAELIATLSALPFYRARGWRGSKAAVKTLTDGVDLVGLLLGKEMAVRQAA